MTDINNPSEEKHFEFVQSFSNFEFAIGYSYTSFEKYKKLVHITFMFWHVSFAW